MTTLLNRFMQFQIDRSDVLSYLLIGGWILSMVSLPVALWTVGEDAVIWGTIASVVLLVSATSHLMAQAWGWQRALLAGVIIIVLGWCVEAAGSKTGIPFGAYSYTERLQPQLLDVPLLIPLAWLMMMPPAWAIAQIIVGERKTLTQQLIFVGISALAFTAWDLFLDPQMVNWSFWVWHSPGMSSYFGIPYVNFAGWLLAAFVMTFVVQPPAFPQRLLQLLIGIYAITCVLQTVGLGLFWQMPGPALCGLIGMGTMLMLALRRMVKYA